ncbi:MAG: Dam family site-specific DNA-(adenine-N6)-methyltransferase [bacterium]|nr:Dam family site-specific DNA-(adenine-N6)-methyltransferase [bacterium]
MSLKVPHIVQYQGSKRKLAPQILQYMPVKFERLIEPFAGMAAISIAAAMENRAKAYIVNDLNAPLVSVLQEAVERPDSLVATYREVWSGQFAYGADHTQHYYCIRERFNEGEQTPANMLYLLARCVKGSVRYGANGRFNQSPDKRRHGTSPNILAQNVRAISSVLKGKTSFHAQDYREIFELARVGDVVYMDPPYQGVTNSRDNRYFSGVLFNDFVESLNILNNKGIDYLISYDGACGQKEYGKELPEALGCKKVLLNAGLSSQEILLGRKTTTFEALYISKSLIPLMQNIPEQLLLTEVTV